MNWIQWKLARGLHAFDSLVLNYKVNSFSNIVMKLYPNGYVKECPWWAMK